MEDKVSFITIEVVYAKSPTIQTLISVKIKAGSTVMDALFASKILQKHPEIKITAGCIGIFGKKVAFDHILEPNDRIEIYRPLAQDPKEARRLRARQKKKSEK